MDTYAIYGGQLITTDGIIPNSTFIVSAGKLNFPLGSEDYWIKNHRLHRYKKINADGLLIAPGFIDLHVHGGNGYDFLEGSADAIKKIAAFHAKGGTTSLLATIVPANGKIIKRSLSAIHALTVKKSGGSRILGTHMEGPYINPHRAGALNPDYLQAVNLEQMAEYISASQGSLKMVTVAPELPGCIDLIKLLLQKEIIVSAGHSEADYETSLSSFILGIRHAVHIFNASIPFHHRVPGLVGAVLTENDINAELIADGQHLHQCTLKLLASVKGKSKLTLATDAICAAGMPDGAYRFNDHKVYLQKRKITLDNGLIAGSSLTMAEAVKNMAAMTGIPLYEAVLMASLNPARIIGIEKCKGVLADGMDADLVLLDKDIKVRLTMVGGEIVFSNLNVFPVGDPE